MILPHKNIFPDGCNYEELEAVSFSLRQSRKRSQWGLDDTVGVMPVSKEGVLPKRPSGGGVRKGKESKKRRRACW